MGMIVEGKGKRTREKEVLKKEPEVPILGKI